MYIFRMKSISTMFAQKLSTATTHGNWNIDRKRLSFGQEISTKRKHYHFDHSAFSL